ncbi:MAG TPA: hypothetical protein VEF04_15705, partial [Blastocatellia bacterium]|nr:hypothetical protein [Blastocatellia bacterium]
MKNAPLTLLSSVRLKRLITSLFVISAVLTFVLATACHKEASQQLANQTAPTTSTPSGDVAA